MQNAGKGGSRAYLAVSGGIDVPEYLGSRATFPSGKLGGLQASALPFGAAAAMLVSAHYHQVAVYSGMLPPALMWSALNRGLQVPHSRLLDGCRCVLAGAQAGSRGCAAAGPN